MTEYKDAVCFAVALLGNAILFALFLNRCRKVVELRRDIDKLIDDNVQLMKDNLKVALTGSGPGFITVRFKTDKGVAVYSGDNPPILLRPGQTAGVLADQELYLYVKDKVWKA